MSAMTITAWQAKTMNEMLQRDGDDITVLDQEDDGAIVIQHLRARYRVLATGTAFRLPPTWMSGEEEAEASLRAWEKLSNGSILMDLSPEELYVVYCQTRDAATYYGVAV